MAGEGITWHQRLMISMTARNSPMNLAVHPESGGLSLCIDQTIVEYSISVGSAHIHCLDGHA